VTDNQNKHSRGMVSLSPSTTSPVILNGNDDPSWVIFEGDGSVDSPYLIQNLFINSTDPYYGSAIWLASITHHVVIQNCVLDAINGFAIQVQDSSNIVITNNTFIHSARGLAIYGGHNFSVTENTFIDRQMIGLYNDSNIAVSNNSLHGILSATEVSSCSVTSNVITEGGISVDSSDDFEISLNDLSNCNISIIISQLRDSLVSQNHIENSRYVGIAVYGIECVNNSVHKNTIIGGEISDYGIRVDEAASGNIIDWNNLINHTVNAYCTSENNTFDYNYYSDYSGTDANGDLIGDSPYDISGGTSLRDLHPRMTTEMVVNTSATSHLEEIIMLVGVSAGIAVLLIAVVIIKRR
jgi:parallel beta-helix repeat protein